MFLGRGYDTYKEEDSFDLVIRIELREFPKSNFLGHAGDETIVYSVDMHTLDLEEVHVTTKTTSKHFDTKRERTQWLRDNGVIND